MSSSRPGLKGGIAGPTIRVYVPSALRNYTGGREEVSLNAPDAGSLLDRLEEAFPGIRGRIVDETGRMRPFVNLFVNEDLVRAPLSQVPLKAGDVVHILPSVAGGLHGG